MTVYNMKRAMNIMGIEKLLEKLKTWKPNYQKATMPLKNLPVLSLFNEEYFSELEIAA